MKNLKNFLIEAKCNECFITEYCNVIAEDTIINESFKLPILKKLAAKIKLWETENRERYKSQLDDYENGKRNFRPSNNEQTFTSIFGPYWINRSKYGDDKIRVRGCKWDQLDDSNVSYYEGGYDSKLHKKIKKMWAHGINGMIIVCDPDTDDIVYVTRGYQHHSGDGRKPKPTTWKFDTYNDSEGKLRRNFKVETTRTQNSRRWNPDRDYNPDEYIELINDYNIYFIEIPDSMIEDYNALTKSRKESQEGVINFDKESLERLARRQRSNYKMLAKELRAKRLAEKPEYVYDDLEKLNGEILEMYRKISNNVEMMDKWYYIGDLMSYASNAFNDYFRYLQRMNSAKKSVEYAKERGEENYERFGKWDRENAAENLHDCKERIDDIRKKIEEFKKLLNEQ